MVRSHDLLSLILHCGVDIINCNTVTIIMKMCLSVEAKKYIVYACWLPWLHCSRLHIINPAKKGITMRSLPLGGHTMSCTHAYVHTRTHTHTHTHTHKLTELDCLYIQQTVFVHQHSMLYSYTPLDH